MCCPFVCCHSTSLPCFGDKVLYCVYLTSLLCVQRTVPHAMGQRTTLVQSWVHSSLGTVLCSGSVGPQPRWCVPALSHLVCVLFAAFSWSACLQLSDPTEPDMLVCVCQLVDMLFGLFCMLSPVLHVQHFRCRFTCLFLYASPLQIRYVVTVCGLPLGVCAAAVFVFVPVSFFVILGRWQCSCDGLSGHIGTAW